MRYRSGWGLGSAIRPRYAPARAREPRALNGGAGLANCGPHTFWDRRAAERSEKTHKTCKNVTF